MGCCYILMLVVCLFCRRTLFFCCSFFLLYCELLIVGLMNNLIKRTANHAEIIQSHRGSLERWSFGILFLSDYWIFCLLSSLGTLMFVFSACFGWQTCIHSKRYIFFFFTWINDTHNRDFFALKRLYWFLSMHIQKWFVVCFIFI